MSGSAGSSAKVFAAAVDALYEGCKPGREQRDRLEDPRDLSLYGDVRKPCFLKSAGP